MRYTILLISVPVDSISVQYMKLTKLENLKITDIVPLKNILTIPLLSRYAIKGLILNLGRFCTLTEDLYWGTKCAKFLGQIHFCDLQEIGCKNLNRDIFGAVFFSFQSFSY